MRETIVMRERVRQDRARQALLEPLENPDNAQIVFEKSRAMGSSFVGGLMRMSSGVSISMRLDTLMAEMNEARGWKTGWAERSLRPSFRDGVKQLFVPGRGWLNLPKKEEEKENGSQSG